MSTSDMDIGAIALGYHGSCVTWRRHKTWQPAVVITQPDCVDDGAYIPACSVMISGVGHLRALRTAIDEALKGADQGGE